MQKAIVSFHEGTQALVTFDEKSSDLCDEKQELDKVVSCTFEFFSTITYMISWEQELNYNLTQLFF